jgi:hypothetical protein
LGKPAFLITAGDLTMNGSQFEWDMYDRIRASSKIPVYEGFGWSKGATQLWEDLVFIVDEINCSSRRHLFATAGEWDAHQRHTVPVFCSLAG